MNGYIYYNIHQGVVEVVKGFIRKRYELLMSFRCLFERAEIISYVAHDPAREREAERAVSTLPFLSIADKANYILIKVINLAGSRRSGQQARRVVGLAVASFPISHWASSIESRRESCFSYKQRTGSGESFMSSPPTRERNWIVASSDTTWKPLKGFRSERSTWLRSLPDHTDHIWKNH